MFTRFKSPFVYFQNISDYIDIWITSITGLLTIHFFYQCTTWHGDELTSPDTSRFKHKQSMPYQMTINHYLLSNIPESIKCCAHSPASVCPKCSWSKRRLSRGLACSAIFTYQMKCISDTPNRSNHLWRWFGWFHKPKEVLSKKMIKPV